MRFIYLSHLNSFQVLDGSASAPRKEKVKKEKENRTSAYLCPLAPQVTIKQNSRFDSRYNKSGLYTVASRQTWVLPWTKHPVHKTSSMHSIDTQSFLLFLHSHSFTLKFLLHFYFHTSKCAKSTKFCLTFLRTHLFVLTSPLSINSSPICNCFYNSFYPYLYYSTYIPVI